MVCQPRQLASSSQVRYRQIPIRRAISATQAVTMATGDCVRGDRPGVATAVALFPGREVAWDTSLSFLGDSWGWVVVCWVGVAAPAQLYSRLMATCALAQYGSERWKRA